MFNTPAMKTLLQLMGLLEEEQFDRLKALLHKKTTRHDAHNVSFLDSLKTYDIKALNNLRIKIGDNAFHALSKRLQDTMINFIGSDTLAGGSSIPQVTARLLAAARTMLEHKAYSPAFKCLAKAEKLAAQEEQFSVLNDVYLLWVQYAHYNSKVPLTVLLEKQDANRKLLDAEEKLTLAYAVLRRELTEIYHKGKVTDLAAVISETFGKLGLNVREVYTYRSLYQLLFILNEQASIRQDFTLLLPYIEKSYHFIHDKKESEQGHLYYRIQILYFLANACLRTRRFTDCNRYLGEMELQLQRDNCRYERRFGARHALLKALNENYSGVPGNAEAVVASALAHSADKDAVDVADLRLTAAVLSLQHQDRTAVKHMREVMRPDGYYEKHMGRDWLIKKILVEVIMHTEFGNSELALTRIAGLRKKFGNYLKEVGEERVLRFIGIVEIFVRHPERATEPTFREQAEGLLAKEEEDLFVMAYAGWLLAKALEKPVYDITLKLVRGIYFSPSHSA